MRLFRGQLPYPRDRDLVRVVRAAASRLAAKLALLDPGSLDLSPETQRLLRHHRKNLEADVERCAHVFAWSLPRNDKPFTDLALVAFNDGIGVFSLLAKECSIATVVYHDSSDVLRSDARTIAGAISRAADHYVFGGTEEIEFIAERHSIACDIFVSSELPVSCGAIHGGHALASLLSTLSKRSAGAISFGFALGEGSPVRENGAHASADLKSFSHELGRLGFDMGVVRGPCAATSRRSGRMEDGSTDNTIIVDTARSPSSNSRSRRSVVLYGSRPVGTYAPSVDRSPATSEPRAIASVRKDTESEEIVIG